jgi:hypothetical protein
MKYDHGYKLEPFKTARTPSAYSLNKERVNKERVSPNELDLS